MPGVENVDALRASDSGPAPERPDDWVEQIRLAWEREYPGLDVDVLPPMIRVARLGVLIDAFQQQVLLPLDLSPNDYGVLALLRRAGEPYRLSPTRLTTTLYRSSGGMTKILRRLEGRGLVAREADPNDGRGSLVALTPAGLALQERAFHAFLEASQELLAPLGESQRKRADRALGELLGAFEATFERDESGGSQ